MISNVSVDALSEQFSIAGVAEIVAGNGGLPRIQIHTAASDAEIYLHGAQVTSWRPAGQEDTIFLSKASYWQDGRAIRGGIPICFPWFRAKADDPKAPSHGFVRTKSWQIDSIEQDGDAVTVTLATESDASTQQWWPYPFRAVHRVTVGAELRLELIVTNTGAETFKFEEALHTYHRVGDATKARVQGLDGVTYLDNTDSNRQKTQQGDMVITKPVDNACLNTRETLLLIDPVLQRTIQIAKENSVTTVVWNPWESGAKALKDLGDDEWREFTCVEASNILTGAVLLEPGEEHVMAATIRVLPE